MTMRGQGREPNGQADAGAGYPQRLRLFRSDLIERRLSVMPPRVFAGVWAVLLPALFGVSLRAASPPSWLGLAVAGLFIWSLFEYAMHRFVFHMKPRSAIGRQVAFVMHGNHHADPNDPDRSLMPFIVSIPWLAVIYGVFALLLGRGGLVVFFGFTVGYVVYDTVHYACHQLPVRGRLMRALRRHHLRHHFGRHEGAYAITAIFWDTVFGSHLSAKAASGLRREA